MNFLSGFSALSLSTSFSLFTIIGVNSLFSSLEKMFFKDLKTSSISFELNALQLVFLLIDVFNRISSAYKLPNPLLARTLTISSSLDFTSSLNSSSVIVSGLIPFSGGKIYSLFALMSLSDHCFLLSGEMILFSSSSSMMFPCENNSTMRVYVMSFFIFIMTTLSKLCCSTLTTLAPLTRFLRSIGK